jgi:elongation factor 1-alpha
MSNDKTHISVSVVGHVDSGKSTTTGRLIYDLGGINEREMEKLKQRAHELGKDSFAFAFYMDTQKEEQERGITISCTAKEFFTERYHYTIVDCPGHRDFIKNMISGASQVDVSLLMVPADGNFATAIAKGDHKSGEVQGQTRQHARLLNLLGVKQIIVCINKMDERSVSYSKERFDEVRNEMIDMLSKVGYKKETIATTIPFIPISGYMGDNLTKVSENMPWWQGVEVTNLNNEKIQVKTVLDALNNFVSVPQRNLDTPLRAPVSGVYKIKGVGDVITARVEQGKVQPGDEVVFLPTSTGSNPCSGKIFTVEMHHKSVEMAGPGDNCGFNIKGLDKSNMPQNGDIMVLKKDSTLKRAKRFTAQVQVLDHPGELKKGYTPIACVRTAHSACRMAEIRWKMGKETGMKKVDAPNAVKANEMAEIVFEPQQPFVVDLFKNCEGLGRLAIFEGNSVVMLGKVTEVEFAEDTASKK